MINLLRGIFRMKSESGTRTVAGAPVALDTRDAAYLTNSQQRLNALQELCGKYKNTPYARKIRTVLDKTQQLHTYLAGRNKAHELELFHLQHTDHFLSTFSTIIDTHRQHATPKSYKSAFNRKVITDPFRKGTQEVKEARQQNMETSREVLADAIAARHEVPRLSVPQISINTYSRLTYLQESPAGALTPHEIGFTSSEQEKEQFAAYVSGRLGLEGVSYMGNALVSLPDNSGPQLPELAPVVQINGFSYIFSIENFHLFPVYTYGKTR